MKIGMMLRNLGELGGIYVYTVNLIEELLKLDKSNQYIFFYNDPKFLGRYAQYKNVTERVVKLPGKLLWDQIAIPRAVKREKIDLLFNPKLSIPLFVNCKTVLIYHGAEQFAVPEIFKWYDRIYFKIMTKYYFAKADAVISTTRKGCKDLARLIGTDEKKIKPIYESHHKRFQIIEDPKQLKKIRQKYSLPEQFILFVGGITPLKNLGNLLRAFKEIKNKLSNLQLVVVGFKRWKFKKDISLIKQLKLEDKVIFTGFVPDDDLPAIYNLAHLYILPSFYEGFGIPVLEAMSCGCPVITSTTGCSSEVAGDAAVLVDPRNAKNIATKIYDVAVNEKLRKTMIEKGMTRSKEFSWEKCGLETLSLFESLVNHN